MSFEDPTGLLHSLIISKIRSLSSSVFVLSFLSKSRYSRWSFQHSVFLHFDHATFRDNLFRSLLPTYTQSYIVYILSSPIHALLPSLCKMLSLSGLDLLKIEVILCHTLLHPFTQYMYLFILVFINFFQQYFLVFSIWFFHILSGWSLCV